MKKTKLFLTFILILLLVVSLGLFVACGETPSQNSSDESSVSTSKSESETNSESVEASKGSSESQSESLTNSSSSSTPNADNHNIISAGDFELNGLELTLKVSNKTEELNLSQMIEIDSQANWVLANDKNGEQTIVTKTVALEEGKSKVVYVIVTSKSGSTSYKATIYRRKMLDVTYELGNGKNLVKQVEEDGLATKLTDAEIPTRDHFEFVGYGTFDFSDPIIEATSIKLIWTSDIFYLDEDNNLKAIEEDITVLTSAEDKTLTGWYLLQGIVSGNFTLTVSGEAHIILEDNCSWTINQGGIIVGSNDSLTIYAQSVVPQDGYTAGTTTRAGKIISLDANIGGANGANGKDGASGVEFGKNGLPGTAGENGGDAGNITINGGSIEVENIGGGNGGVGGAGGSGGYSSGSTKGLTKAGVGYSGSVGGNGGNVSSITINGGDIGVVNIGGGNGGKGGAGGKGGYFNKTGSSGGNGGNGAKGGNGGSVGSLIINTNCVYGSTIGGGNGGEGGSGGSGAGAEDFVGSSTKGKGGNGGKGGVGGVGGDVEKMVINTELLFKRMSVIGGGNGGEGGNGGYGGKGADYTQGFGDSTTTLYTGGVGGNGGNGGNGGKAGQLVSLITKGSIAKDININKGAGGAAGSGVRGGNGGTGSINAENGAKGITGTDGVVGALSEKASVYYQGTQAEWEATATTIDNADIYFYSETQPEKAGNYWHFDEFGNNAIKW